MAINNKCDSGLIQFWVWLDCNAFNVLSMTYAFNALDIEQAFMVKVFASIQSEIFLLRFSFLKC